MPAHNSLDEYLASVRYNLNAPTPLFLLQGDIALSKFFSGMHKSKGFTSLALCNFAYSSWRTATLLSITGNTHQIPAILRLTIEAMIYAHLFKLSPEWKRTWRARHQSRSQQDKFRKGGAKAAEDALRSVSPDLLKSYRRLYDQFVSFGAHPNPIAIDLAIEISFNEGEEDGLALFSQLTGENERYISGIQIADVGNFMLCLLRHIWPERYDLLVIEPARKEFLAQTHFYIECRKAKFAESTPSVMRGAHPIPPDRPPQAV
ncbi:hypothetical protein [Haematobacter genomosp. 1]|uniref:hypothetical protein n=1 Tax=Haematobacter genomosp. 1 TaxID=366618 RepID=UPI00117B4974|nr:hypothetical protein [Haematobacter genomosp. 1]